MEEEDYIKNIGQNIRLQRAKQNLTQLQLAESIGIEDSALRRIENGRTNPTIKTLFRIAKALHIRVEDLLSFQK